MRCAFAFERVAFGRELLTLAIAIALVACGGESTSFEDRGSGGDAGDPGSGGSARGGTSSTGGAGTGGTAAGGSPSGGTSAGGSSAGTGGTPPPPDGQCDDVPVCGGDPEGSWLVRENCTEFLVPILTEPGCEDVLMAVSADIEGEYVFEGGVMTQNVTITAWGTMTVTDACAEGFTGLPDVTAADVCPLLDAQLRSQAETPGSCVPDANGCRCDFTQPPTESNTVDTYDVVGNQIVSSSGEAIDFCVQGETLLLRGEVTEPDTSALGALTMLLDRQ